MLVAPRVGAWIETPIQRDRRYNCIASHPVWVRGLKRLRTHNIYSPWPSHPVWVRGLKHEVTVIGGRQIFVAPRVGAWIETKEMIKSAWPFGSRTPCGCVD